MAKTKHRTAPDPDQKGWPKSVPYIIGNEGCERFSFYGMRAILYVYIVGLYMNRLGMDPGVADAKATSTYHLFVGAVYAFPIIGAILADRVLGKYRTIFWLSLVYCAGHAALALFESPALQLQWFGRVFIDPVQGMYLGLALIGIGSGGIKPCVSANVGDQFGRGNWHLLQKVFNAFYFIINFGSAFATLIIPRIRGEKVVNLVWNEGGAGEIGYPVSQGGDWAFALPDVTMQVEYTGSVSWAFAVPGILMGIATICFWAGRNKYVHVPPSTPGKIGWLDFLAGSALFAVVAVPIFNYEYYFIEEFPNRGRLLALGIICGSCFALFVALFTARQKIEQDDGFLAIMFYCFMRVIRGANVQSAGKTRSTEEEASWLTNHFFFGHAVQRFGLRAAEGPVAVLKIMCVFSFVSLFWALFDQHSSTWIKQAELMDRNVAFNLINCLGIGLLLGLITAGAFLLTFKSYAGVFAALICVAGGLGGGYLISAAISGGYLTELDASQIPAANPFMVMLLIPYCNFGLYPLMGRLGLNPTPLRRMTIGMAMTGLSFVAVAIIQTAIDGGAEVHVFWQLIPYLVLTLSEVMVSITGLEFAYSQAPKKMKSVIMGFWLFTVTIGNLIVSLTSSQFEKLDLFSFFRLFAGMMFAAAFAFGIVTLFYKYKDFTQSGDDSDKSDEK